MCTFISYDAALSRPRDPHGAPRSHRPGIRGLRRGLSPWRLRGLSHAAGGWLHVSSVLRLCRRRVRAHSLEHEIPDRKRRSHHATPHPRARRPLVRALFWRHVPWNKRARTAESSAHIARTLLSRSAKEQLHSLVAQQSSR